MIIAKIKFDKAKFKSRIFESCTVDWYTTNPIIVTGKPLLKFIARQNIKPTIAKIPFPRIWGPTRSKCINNIKNVGNNAIIAPAKGKNNFPKKKLKTNKT